MPSLFRKLTARASGAAAVTIIGITCLVAVFAYMLAPDKTPNANNMVVELGARQPGFTKLLLLVPKSRKAVKKNPVAEWFSGIPSDFQAVPINTYSFAGEKLLIRHYIDDAIEDTLVYSFARLLPAEQLLQPFAERQKYIEHHLLKKRTYYLGTDRYGRDILSRLLIGSRVSLSVGLIAVLLSLTIGIALGTLAGYYGGLVDNAVMLAINIIWSIPTLLLVFAITLTIGKGFWEIFVAIGLTMWVSASRLVRGQTLALREMEYITAARALGLYDLRIIFRHILPNISGPLMVTAASNFAAAILIEAGLSFLGIGVQPPQPSWGLMIKEHYMFLLTGRPLLAIIPGVAIMLLVYAFNILGNALRDLLDVTS